MLNAFATLRSSFGNCAILTICMHKNQYIAPHDSQHSRQRQVDEMLSSVVCMCVWERKREKNGKNDNPNDGKNVVFLIHFSFFPSFLLFVCNTWCRQRLYSVDWRPKWIICEHSLVQCMQSPGELPPLHGSAKTTCCEYFFPFFFYSLKI